MSGKGITSQQCWGKPPTVFIPQPHQRETLKKFVTSPYKGMLLYHKLGSGKTCTSIMIADALLATHKVTHVYLLTPGSLRSGWVTEFCKVCGSNPKEMPRNYTYITYNFDVWKRLPDFNKSLIVIDEVHLFINSVKNDSKNAVEIYNAIKKADCRVLVLSGTPINHYVHEFQILANLLKPGVFPYGSESFDESWSSDKHLDEKLSGIVSYFPGSGGKFYPSVIYKKPVKVRMSREQNSAYENAMRKEFKFSRAPLEKLKFTNPQKYYLDKMMWQKAMQKQFTRAASNFYYDTENLPDKLVKDGGWVECEAFKNKKLLTYSPKFAALLTNIISYPNVKHVVFSFFVTKHGVNLLKAMLDMVGIKAALYSGELEDSNRVTLLRRFNNVENRTGKNIQVLLVTMGSGSSGITILEARHTHVLESSIRETMIQQAIGRIVRFKSHFNMPVNEQNVTIWRYWSTPKSGVGIDEYLYTKGLQAQVKRDDFLKRLQQMSVTMYERS